MRSVMSCVSWTQTCLQSHVSWWENRVGISDLVLCSVVTNSKERTYSWLCSALDVAWSGRHWLFIYIFRNCFDLHLSHFSLNRININVNVVSYVLFPTINSINTIKKGPFPIRLPTQNSESKHLLLFLYYPPTSPWIRHYLKKNNFNN